MEQKPVVEIDFAELSDGSLVEMIEDPADATKTLFAVYRNQSADIPRASRIGAGSWCRFREMIKI